MDTIIFATGNKNKMIEIRMILEDLGCKILSQKEAGIQADVVEDGKTFEENALIKATTIADIARKMPEYKNAVVLADDSGLEIDALNKELSGKDGSLIGINSFTLDGDEAAISEAKAVLKKKDASYRNVYFDSDSEAGKFVENVYAYPTTYVVDRSGSIVGEPIVGAVTGKSQMKKLKSLIDQCIAADMK